MCAGQSACPFFAAHHKVMLQLMRLTTQRRDSWVRRLRALACTRPPLGDRFLMDYYPRPLEGGPPLLPYARRPPRVRPKSVPLAAPQLSRPPGAGSGTQGEIWLEHGAPSCPRCRSLGWGFSRCCRAGHEGHTDPSAGPRFPRIPPRVAPGRQVLVLEDRRSCAVLVARLGAPCLPSPLGLGPPASRRCTLPPRLWAHAFPRPWGLTTPDPQNAPSLTSWLTGGVQ